MRPNSLIVGDSFEDDGMRNRPAKRARPPMGIINGSGLDEVEEK